MASFPDEPHISSRFLVLMSLKRQRAGVVRNDQRPYSRMIHSGGRYILWGGNNWPSTSSTMLLSKASLKLLPLGKNAAETCLLPPQLFLHLRVAYLHATSLLKLLNFAEAKRTNSTQGIK